MHIVGDCHCTDTVRIEGRLEGSVRADKAVVVGEGGQVTGDILTQDAVIAGQVKGALDVHSRLELHATCVVDGEIRAKRIRLDEGGIVNGNISIGPKEEPRHPPAQAAQPQRTDRQGGGRLRGGGKGKLGPST